MCTDTSWDPIDIIRLHGLRRRIQHIFEQAVQLAGSVTYHLWMTNMKPLRSNNGNEPLHSTSLDYRSRAKRKPHACHVFTQPGIICQRPFQHLAVAHTQLVWNSFSSWLRVRWGPSFVLD
jgi:hypothetical protein